MDEKKTRILFLTETEEYSCYKEAILIIYLLTKRVITSSFLITAYFTGLPTTRGSVTFTGCILAPKIREKKTNFIANI